MIVKLKEIIYKDYGIPAGKKRAETRAGYLIFWYRSGIREGNVVGWSEAYSTLQKTKPLEPGVRHKIFTWPRVESVNAHIESENSFPGHQYDFISTI